MMANSVIAKLGTLKFVEIFFSSRKLNSLLELEGRKYCPNSAVMQEMTAR